MNATLCASLFRLRDKVMFFAFFSFFSFIAFLASIPKRHGKPEVDISFFILIPPLALAGLLAEVWNRPFQRPTTVLLPGVKDSLFRWFCGLLLATASIWAIAIHRLEPAIPLAAALGISVGITSLGSLTILRTPWRSKAFAYAFGFGGMLIGFNAPSLFSFLQLRGNLFTSHALFFGVAGYALAAVNLWLARQRNVRGSLAPRRARGKRSASQRNWNYPPRGTSRWQWARAALQENAGGPWWYIAGCTLIPLLHPWASQRDGGFPLGWYRLVFAPDHTGDITGSVIALSIAMVAFSLVGGMLRTDRLYPISRRRRASIAYSVSAATFAVNFLAIAGGSLLIAWIVGQSLGLPMPWQRAAEFVVRMATVVPFMPLMRWIALRMELSQSFVELFISIGFVAAMVIASQNLILEGGLAVGASICGVTIISSQLIYRSWLRDFYVNSDLVRQGPNQRTADFV